MTSGIHPTRAETGTAAALGGGTVAVPVNPALVREMLSGCVAGPMAGQAGADILHWLPAAVYTCDREGFITFFNEAAVRLWGRRPQFGVDRWCGATRLYRPDGSELPLGDCLMTRAIRENREFEGCEVVVERPDGVKRTVLAHPRPLHDAAGNVIGGLNLLLDLTEQRRAEADRRASEQRFQALVRTVPAIVWTADANGALEFVSERWFEFSGCERDAPVFAGAVHPDDLAARTAAWQQALAAGSDYRGEWRLRGRDGEYRWFLTRAVPARDAGGRIAGWIGSTTDIHDLKTAERAWRQAEERLRTATRSGKVGLWEWDIVANRVTWTESLYEIHGVRAGEFGGTVEAFTALIHPEDRAPVGRAIRSSVEHGVPYELEFRAVRPGGAVVWIFTNAVVVREDGRAVRMHGASFDITARKLAELALRETEARFRTLASHAPVGIFLADVAGQCQFVNDCWREITGLTPDEARGDGWLQAVQRDDRAQVTAAWQRAIARREGFAAEFRFERRDGLTTWVQSSSVEFKNAAGVVAGYIGTAVDVTERRAAEIALRESEKRFRTLASLAPVGIFLTDPQGRTMFVNESWCEMAGVAAGDAVDFGWTEALHPDDRERVLAGWTEAVRQGASSAVEFRFVHRDGRTIWVQGNAVQLRETSGAAAGFIGTIVDITARRAAEERLKAREAQLRFISTNAPIGLAHCGRDRRFLFVNRPYARRLGAEPEAMIGRTIEEMLGGEVARALEPHIVRVLGGEAFTFELELDYPKLGRRFVRASYAPDFAGDGEVRGWLAVVNDLTERRMAEEALRDSETKFRQLADSMPQLVWTASPDGAVDYYNLRLAEYTAVPQTGGRWDWMPLLHPDDLPPTQAAWQEALRGGTNYEQEHRIKMADGSYRWHLSRGRPVRDAAGRIVKWYGTGTDIHDAKITQQELQEAQRLLQAYAEDLEQRVQERTASLREAVAQLEEFSYSVSHDLRSPLRAMKAYAQALIEDYGPQLDDTARNYLERIQRGSLRMEALTHDMLAYSRVARAEVSLTGVDLRPLLADVIGQYAELQPEAATVELVEPLARVRAHEPSLGQALANVLTNAAKFVPPGVRPRIVVSTETSGDRVKIRIQDNGIGIDPEHHERLFRVFERVPTRHPYDGTGIGLAIVRKAMEKMNGRCGVESDGRNGSCFWIELPRG